MLLLILATSTLALALADRYDQAALRVLSADPHGYMGGLHLNRGKRNYGEGTSPQYAITLNSSQNATLYCYSDYLHNIRLTSEECWTCEEVRRRNCTSDDQECISCKEACSERRRRCPTIPGEYSTCLAVNSSVNPRRYYCMGYTESGAVLVVNIDLVQHDGPKTCYGEEEAGVPVIPPPDGILETGSIESYVTYKDPVLCVIPSDVTNLDAGHLLTTGYTIGPFVRRKKLLEHEKEYPEFRTFCEITRPKLWKLKMGSQFRCNGSYHILKDEFPCLQFSPSGRGFRLPSLEHCSAAQMVGIVIVMVVAMILCYTLFIMCIKIWTACCRSRQKEMILVPLAQAGDHSSHASRTTLQSGVVKQESKDSMVSQSNANKVIVQPGPNQPVTV